MTCVVGGDIPRGNSSIFHYAPFSACHEQGGSVIFSVHAQSSILSDDPPPTKLNPSRDSLLSFGGDVVGERVADALFVFRAVVLLTPRGAFLC